MTTDGHDLESTAFRMTERVPLAAPGDTAEMIRASLAGRHFDSAADIAILEGDRLVGLIRLEDLLAAPPEATAASLMDDDPPVVAPGADRELAAGALDRADWGAAQAGRLTTRRLELDALARALTADLALEDALRRPLSGPELMIGRGEQ